MVTRAAVRFLVFTLFCTAVAGCGEPKVTDAGPQIEPAPVALAMAWLGAKSLSTAGVIAVPGGSAQFESLQNGTMKLTVLVRGMPAGEHGVHLHETADCSDSAALSAGAHWNPSGNPHGAHAGDVGNVLVGADGTGKLEVVRDEWSIRGSRETDVLGKAVVVHASADDGTSQPGGAAGARIACGVVRAPGDPAKQAMVSVLGASGSSVSATASFYEIGGQTTLVLGITGATPGHHAVHLHEFGDCTSTDALSAGAHWNPTTSAHGVWGGASFHLGDVGNVDIDADGNGSLVFTTDLWSVGGSPVTDVIGRALVIHAGHDDETPPAGNAGARVGCGVIRYADNRALIAHSTLAPKSGSTATGRATFTAGGGTVTVRVSVEGATPGEHGVHIHERADCSSPDALSAGGHWNPTRAAHGELGHGSFHLGDIGNLVVGSTGTGTLVRTVPYWSIHGSKLTSVLGHSVVVHALADDGDSQPAGNAGARIACGEISL